MAVYTHLLQQSFQQAQAQAGPMLGRCLDVVIAEFQAAEEATRSIAERDRMGLAWRGLARNKPIWIHDFPSLLGKALHADVGAHAEGPQVAAAEPPWAGLALEDASKTDESIEASRLLQSLMLVVDAERATLDGLMSSVLGLDTVCPERNPLRPEIIGRLLSELLVPAESAAELRALWLRHLARPLGKELKALYTSVIGILEAAQVHAAAYRVKLAVQPRTSGRSGPDGAAGVASGPGSGGAGATAGSGGDGGDGGDGSHWQQAGMPHGLPGMPVLAQARSAVPQEVLHDFLNARSSRFDQPLSADYFAMVDEQLAAVERDAVTARVDEEALHRERVRHQDLPVVERPHRPVDTDTPLSPHQWGASALPLERTRVLMQLKREALRVGQVLGLDVVRTLVNQVGHDPRLLAPVREAVVALEPALLRMAFANPRFFNEERHPARRLVEAVAQRSFRFNDEFGSEFGGFHEDVRRTFQDLNAVAAPDPGAFAGALDQLEQLWGQQDQQEQLLQGDGLQSIRFAEERQSMADEEAWELSKRPDLNGVPAVVLNFLYETWSLVLAHARLTDTLGQIDPGGYRAAVSDLLWSVKKEVTLRRPARLIDLVPGLVQTLHAGLQLLGKDREETRPFFDALMRLHNPVLKLRRARSRQDARASAAGLAEATSGAGELDDALDDAAAPPVPIKAEQPWLARNELDAAGFQDTLPSDYAELVVLRDEVQPETDATRPMVHAQPDVDAAAVLGSLREGSWVDLYSKRQWLRAQLIWASTKGTLFMFVSRGGRPHSMTKRSCERLIVERLLRPLGTGAVMDKAIGAIATEKPQRAEPVAA